MLMLMGKDNQMKLPNKQDRYIYTTVAIIPCHI